jgi:hypothetical protein
MILMAHLPKKEAGHDQHGERQYRHGPEKQYALAGRSSDTHCELGEIDCATLGDSSGGRHPRALGKGARCKKMKTGKRSHDCSSSIAQALLLKPERMAAVELAY